MPLLDRDAQGPVLEASQSSLPVRFNTQTKRAWPWNLKNQNKATKFRTVIAYFLSEMNCARNEEWIVWPKVYTIISFPKFCRYEIVKEMKHKMQLM